MSADMKTDYDYTEPVKQRGRNELVDNRYYKGWLGLLKLLEGVCCLIAYVCLMTSPVYCIGGYATLKYLQYITISCVVTTAILYGFLLFKLPKRILRCDCINWIFIEMCYYVGVIILLFFGDLFMALHGMCYILVLQVADAFGWFAWVFYVVDFVLALISWRSGRKELAAPKTSQSTYRQASSTEDGHTIASN